MEYRELGRTGVFVSAVSLGTMTFGGKSSPIWSTVGALSQDESQHLVDAALDAGVNLFSTADAYGDGEAEEILGRTLGSRREDVLVSTKVAMRVGSGPNEFGVSRLHVMRSIERSLRRLGTDYIDIYMIHTFDQHTALEDTLTALDDAVHQGKIRYLGASNIAAWQAMKALGVVQRLGLTGLAALESYYSLVGRQIEAEILPMAQDQHIGHITYSPLAGGLLSGKFDRTGTTDETARWAKAQQPPVDIELAYSVIDALRAVAQRHGTSVARVALAWVLARPGVTSVSLGAKRPAQLADNLGALDVRLEPKDIEELDAASAPATPAYPNYMQDQYLAFMRPASA
ncbi:aldo/keto reductase [Phytohabitans flavus]|uniref:Aldo/keto reductase n=1 Tax=Phytohabitans flavus TaxID=1076124 RepID=A0A6F8XLE6_9ACTN|nr:aldo/keto reductase [Phytohabitans flavus]BCB74640.1 aldo/keto reductase [Phytohabitans flavus]